MQLAHLVMQQEVEIPFCFRISSGAKSILTSLKSFYSTENGELHYAN